MDNPADQTGEFTNPRDIALGLVEKACKDAAGDMMSRAEIERLLNQLGLLSFGFSQTTENLLDGVAIQFKVADDDTNPDPSPLPVIRFATALIYTGTFLLSHCMDQKPQHGGDS